jgi:hypothetical protein
MGLLSRFSNNDKKGGIGKAKGALGSFCSLLPDKERASIVLLLLEIAQSNDKVTNSENKMIICVLNFLSIASPSDINTEGQKILKDITDKMEIHEALENLKQLSELQKREVMIWFSSILNMDEPNQRSFQLIHAAAKMMDIDVNSFAQQNQDVIMEFIKNI